MTELLETAEAFGRLKARDAQLAGDIDTGIVECLQQTLYFSVLHGGFRESFGMSARDYVAQLLDQQIYCMAFANAKDLSTKQRLLKLLFQHRMPGVIAAMFRANKLLFDAKNSLIGNRKQTDGETE